MSCLERLTVWESRKAILSNSIKRELLSFPGVEEPGMLYNDYTVTRETLRSSVMSMANNLMRGGSQMTERESDNLIVPMKSGNADGGKEVTRYHSW
jgi:hypothetical protein